MRGFGKKKILFLLLASAFAFGFFACGGDDPGEERRGPMRPMPALKRRKPPVPGRRQNLMQTAPKSITAGMLSI